MYQIGGFKMSFVPNNYSQLTLDDPVYSLTSREHKFLKKSWATYFADYIFPKINENRFSVLYSDNSATRPGTPVNVTVGALLIKEMRNQTDDEILESVLFDLRYQYALHTTSMKEQPISDRTLGRFRAKCLAYETETGRDLIKEEIQSLSAELATMMKIDGKMLRMDSMMIASNIKNMSRLELLYTCLSNLVKEMETLEISLPSELNHYVEADDANKVIYHNQSDTSLDKITVILKDCKTTLNLCKEDDFETSSNYILLKRVLSEQTVYENDAYRLKTKEDGGMNGGMLQNPSDPDATFRQKAGNNHKGYSANIVESVGENGSIVTDYDFDNNLHSDSDYLKETVAEMGLQEEKVTIVADGAFGGEANKKMAEANNIDLVTTNLTGRETPDINADFEFNENGTQVIKCPNGCEPKSCSYNKVSGQCVVSFHLHQCVNCPHFEKCNPTMKKRTFKKTVSLSSKHRAESQRFRNSEEFSKLTRIRNGVETVPSYLRRSHNVDHMPVRGRLRCKQFFGLKIGGSNIKKFCRYMQSLIKCTPKCQMV